MFPSTSSRETLRLSEKQNSLFPSGAHIKCILFPPASNLTPSAAQATLDLVYKLFLFRCFSVITLDQKCLN